MRKETTLPIFFLLFIVAIIAIQCKKQNGQSGQPTVIEKSGSIKGKVSNEYNQLLPGASLKIIGDGANTSVTASDGNYIFNSLKPGSYILSVKKDGYLDATTSVSITSGDTTIKDFVLKAGTPYFNLLSDSVIILKPFAGKFSIKVSSNTSWTISNSNSWLTPDKLISNGNDSVQVNVAAWTEDSVREGNIVIQSGNIIKNIRIKQLAEVKLQQTIAIPGNLSLGVGDSIALVFNQPVTIKSIFPGYTNCLADIKYSYSNNKVTFSYACGALGGDYPFTITTNDSLGNQYTFTFSVGFYQKIINLTGTIQSSVVNDADNSYWIITDHPNALYKIDMTSLNIIHKYDLPNEPVTFTFNPYNNKIYIAYLRIPKLYVMNQDGSTDQVIDIPHDTTRGIYEFNGPLIYPIQIAFTKNGKGMIWLDDIYRSGYSYFWFIDAADNHKIWYESLPGYVANGYILPKVNYDKTKILVRAVNSDPTIGIFDMAQMSFSSYRPGNYDIPNFITPSRQNDNMYVGQLYTQFIKNLSTGSESLVINNNSGNAANIDFCYKPGRDLSVYYTEGGLMEAVDYTTGKVPVKYNAIYYLQGTTATLDGKYIIVNRHDGNYNAKVIQFPTSWFNY